MIVSEPSDILMLSEANLCAFSIQPDNEFRYLVDRIFFQLYSILPDLRPDIRNSARHKSVYGLRLIYCIWARTKAGYSVHV